MFTEFAEFIQLMTLRLKLAHPRGHYSKQLMTFLSKYMALLLYIFCRIYRSDGV